jgi:hypothetical protein
MGNKMYPALISVALILVSNLAFGEPTVGGSSSGPANHELGVVVAEPLSASARNTCTLDIPWDWAHRCPPHSSYSLSEPVIKPFVLGCPAQTVKIPMGDGKERTVTIVRCP